MIHEIMPQKYHNEYRPEAPAADSILLFYDGDEMLIKKENTVEFPSFAELEDANQYGREGKGLTYLFSIDNIRYYLAPDRPVLKTEIEEQCEMAKIMAVRTGQGHKTAKFAAVTGGQLYRWYKANRFCGCCGQLMKHDEKERMVRCDSCGNMVYPKISPCVIVAVTDGDRVMLTKYSGRAFTRYALIAGFTEIGEPLEDTVRREVMEEVGLKVKNIRYYKSQPWSFTDTLLMGFFCDLDGDDTVTLDTNELSVGEWVNREDVTDLCEDIALTNEMMVAFHRGLEPKMGQCYLPPEYPFFVNKEEQLKK